MSQKKESTKKTETELLYDKLVATHPDIKRKGDTNPYTSHNGHMFTLLLKKERLGIRLPEKERDAFIKKYKAQLLEAYGIVMKEYVEVPAGLLKKTAELKPYLLQSYEYVKTLKPAPLKKTKK